MMKGKSNLEIEQSTVFQKTSIFPSICVRIYVYMHVHVTCIHQSINPMSMFLSIYMHVHEHSCACVRECMESKICGLCT